MNRIRTSIQLVLAGTMLASAVAAGDELETADAAERYQRLVRQLAEMENQAKTLDILIDRAETMASTRGRGTEAPAVTVIEEPVAQTQASATEASGTEASGTEASGTEEPEQRVVAAARREEAQAQAQEMPDLPRVSTEVGGVLTPRRSLVIEPSWQYSFSSVNRVAIEGFTILPALLVGIIDIAEADRETNVASFTARYGITNRFEMDIKGSYVRRNDTTRSREFLTDSVEESTFSSSGSGPGDYELGMRYQFKRSSPTAPYLVGNLRYKSASGSDPFELAKQSQLTGDPQFTHKLPTGSGFRSLSPSLTMIYPTDPVVFFGSLGYLWTERDDKGKWLNSEGEQVGFGIVDPGDAVRLSFGLGIGLNDKASLSISYQLDRFSKTWIETAGQQSIAGSDATVGKLLIGYSLRPNSGNPLNLAFGIGATGDAPDTDLSFRMPFSFN